MATSTVQPVRFMALDMHKHYVMVGAVNKEQEVLLRPKKFTWSEFDRWQAQHVGPGDEIVIEASSNAWHVYDQLSARKAVVHVANPLLVKWIGAAPVKTDPHDTLKLAKLLAAGLLPTVWVPPAPVRALRTLVGQRRRWIKQRTQTRNRLQSLLQGHNLLPPEGDLFAPEQRAWWQTLDLPPGERLLLTQDLLALDQLAPLIDQVETAIQLQNTCEPWASEVPYVLQQTGIGLVTAMTVLAAIGDINRFAHPSQLVGYAGLGARVHESGQTHNTGGITKQGRRELRAAMVETAWVAVVHNAFWKAKFAALPAPPGRRQGHRGHCPPDAGQHLVSLAQPHRGPPLQCNGHCPQTVGLGRAGRQADAPRPDLRAFCSLATGPTGDRPGLDRAALRQPRLPPAAYRCRGEPTGRQLTPAA